MRTVTLSLALLLLIGCSGDGPTQPPLEVDAALAKVGSKPAPSLKNTIEYVFVGHLGIVRLAAGKTLGPPEGCHHRALVRPDGVEAPHDHAQEHVGDETEEKSQNFHTNLLGCSQRGLVLSTIG